MKLSIIIPVYNEKKTIIEILSRVLALSLDQEVIIVDDGSFDGTDQVLQKYQFHPKIKIIRHKQNLGKGYAIRTGLRKAEGEIVVIQDADLEYDPADFPKLIKPISEGRAAVVYGSRHLDSTNKKHSGPLFYLGGMLLTYLARWLYGIKITDILTCYKMMKIELWRSLNLQCQRFESCSEITAKIAKRKIPILELPISYSPRSRREGKKIKLIDGLENIWILIKYKFIDQRTTKNHYGRR